MRHSDAMTPSNGRTLKNIQIYGGKNTYKWCHNYSDSETDPETANERATELKVTSSDPMIRFWVLNRR